MTPRPGKIEKSYELDFDRKFIQCRNAREVTCDPEFVRMREIILADIQQG